MKKFTKSLIAVVALLVVQLSLCSIVSAETIANDNIPKLAKLTQISPNQIEITYDRDVDVSLGIKATNYWVQDLVNKIPEGIASLGKDDKVNNKNSLTENQVKIEAKEDSQRTFVITFARDIPRGAEYKLIICYVTVPGAPPYSGDNGMMNFVGK
ncbi:MAG: hypothetical protein KIB43_04410 [Clostridium baratii]|uniref:Lipoprotein n=1 Tax=Clostridium baratii str. Sullivan TaxID=1415775 RepID=A0A0A7FXQ2_9CLOT|nr:hypothetical protein [Clostridium baratii]AIY83710.1 hypothetical protein U729_2427 [Clostridium baratii str. Sullivan]MBS6006180.1 hypothetical protein [Clostridium baratii]